jgi:glyceraldehyde-3-phosphate dehydrogenase/erythrose-4-phosphate dehydrogenase
VKTIHRSMQQDRAVKLPSDAWRRRNREAERAIDRATGADIAPILEI